MSKDLTIHPTSELSKIHPSKFDRAIIDFLANQKASTRRIYEKSLKDFFGMFPGLTPDKTTSLHITTFKRTLQEHGTNNATIYNRISAISAFFKYMMIPADTTGTALIESNPVNANHRKDIKVNPYTRARKCGKDEFKAIVAQIDTETEKGLRDLAIIYLYAMTGKRNSEIARLRYSNLVFENGSVFFVIQGKGDKQVRDEIVKPIWEMISAYWKKSGRTVLGNAPIFTATVDNAKYLHHQSSEEKPLSGDAILQMIKRYARRAGLDPNKIIIHGLRHLFAEIRAEIGERVEEIQEKLGHANLNTTQIYLNRIKHKKDKNWKKAWVALE